MSAADFTPLFEGHVASDDACSLDDQISALWAYFSFIAESWDRSAKAAPKTPEAKAYYAHRKELALAPIRAAIATLTRVRDADLAPVPGARP